MAKARNFEVVIAGGGIAGVSVAAALGEFGYRVLLVEPGQNDSRRLAGELIHPPGVTDLTELGLIESVKNVRPVPIHGFAIFVGSGASYTLPYGAISNLQCEGLGVERSALRQALLGAAQSLPHVEVWKGARVTALNLDRGANAKVTVRHQSEDKEVQCRLVVGADGSNSPVSTLAGITRHRSAVSYLAAYELDLACLPLPAYGHVLLHNGSLALACPISAKSARVLFDIPGRWQPTRNRIEQLAGLQAFPAPLRSAVTNAMQTQNPLFAASHFTAPRAVVKHRLVLAGDAAGCCHPLTATGMSVCTRDALLLRQALREANGDIPKTLRWYATRRAGPERTRVALARALYNIFTSKTLSMELLRDGLLRYWQGSASGRADSMALLCTAEGRMPTLIREYVRVMWYSMRDERVLSPRTAQLASGAVINLLVASHRAYVQR